MKIMYRDDKWLTGQAQTLEGKIMKTYGRSWTYSTIERMLTNGVDNQSSAIIELRQYPNGTMVVFDEGQYKINKGDIISEAEKKFKRKGTKCLNESQ